MRKLLSLLALSFALITNINAETNKNVEQAAKKIVTDYLTALQKGDMARVTALLDKNIIWHQPGSNTFTGVKHGVKEVMDMIGGMFKVTQGTLQLDIKWVSANGNKVATLLQFRANRPGAKMDTGSIDVYTVKNGKIVEAYLFTELNQMEDELLGAK